MRRPACPPRGFTLVELLIVVAIIGIIAALLVPSFLDALQKGRQKRTMADMREIGNGVTQYYTDHAGAGAAGALTIDVADWTGTASNEELRSALVPSYVPEFIEQDAWGNDLDFRVQLQPAAQYYALIRSPGLDGVLDGDSYTVGAFTATDYDQDLVWGDGTFLRRPEAKQP